MDSGRMHHRIRGASTVLSLYHFAAFAMFRMVMK